MRVTDRRCVGHLLRERRQADPAELESQPDRLRCNWRAHYLVLSHRDNYPRGRFHQAPSLKHDDDDVTRRARSSLYEIFRFFFRRVSERARKASRLAAYDGRQRDILCAVLRSPIYTKYRLRVDEGLKARSLFLFLFPPALLLYLIFARYTCHFYWRRLSSPREKVLGSSVCATVPKTHKKCIIAEIFISLLAHGALASRRCILLDTLNTLNRETEFFVVFNVK